jgi:hypothetical protein
LTSSFSQPTFHWCCKYHVVITKEETKSTKRGVELTTISYTLSLPTKFVEIFVVVVSTKVEELEKHIIPKFVPLIIIEIRVGLEVTLIDIVTHAFEKN